MPVFVGCDLGTLGTKAGVVDESGELLSLAHEELQLSYPRPGCVEQDLADIEASAYRCIRRALELSGRVSDVAGVAFSGQMSGIGAIGPDHAPVAHFDSWLDTRCEPYIARMSVHAERITELSGCPPTYSHGPKMLWWREERPEVWERITRFVVLSAYVAGRLGGLSGPDAYIDRTHLHFSNLADTARSRWSPELMELFGISDVLPQIVDPLDVIGTVTRDGFSATGLPVGTPIAAGAGDQAAAALGAGVISPGQAFDSAGTASVLALCVSEFRPGQVVMAAHGVPRGTYLSLSFINGGGLALRWFRDTLAPSLSYAELDALAAAVPPGADGLLWSPHLQGRVLPPQPAVRGAWVGLTAGHTLGHLWRAMLEGIAYEYASWVGIAGASLREARVLGGGAASGLWNQIKADVLGIDWVPMRRVECGVLGDALIAAVATGHLTDLAVDWPALASPVHPSGVGSYARLLAAYQELGPALSPIFDRLAP